MTGTRTLLNPGHRHLAAFVLVSFLLHLLWFVWYALQGAQMFAPLQDGGILGIGGGEDIIFELSRGDSGGADQELPEVEMDFREAFQDTLNEDTIEAPVIEEEAAVPLAPSPDDGKDAKAKEDADKAKAAAEAAAKASKARAGGDGGDAERTRKNRGGTGLSGAQIGSSVTGRTLNLIAGRLDIPAGNRLMNVKLNLFPDGTMRVDLVYFHYKTFHKLVTSTRRLKGDGTWFIEGNSLCLKAMVIDYGTVNCYEMNQRENGELDFYFTTCSNRSSSTCSSGRLGAQGRIGSGIE